MDQNSSVAPKADWPTPITAEKPTLEVRRRILLTKSASEDIVASSKLANSFAAVQRIFGYVYKFSSRIHRPTLTVSDLQGLVQRSHLLDDIKSLQSKGMVHSSSSLAFRHSLTNLGFLEWMAG